MTDHLMTDWQKQDKNRQTGIFGVVNVLNILVYIIQQYINQ